MIEQLFENSNVASAKAMLEMAAARHQVLSGNLANVHTPGFKRMDVSEAFLDQLKAAIRTRDANEINSIGEPVVERADLTLWPDRSEDGNNVNLEMEMTMMSENAMTFEANAQFLSASLKRLESAITGRVS